jgi:hypothetical protein
MHWPVQSDRNCEVPFKLAARFDRDPVAGETARSCFRFDSSLWRSIQRHTRSLDDRAASLPSVSVAVAVLTDQYAYSLPGLAASTSQGQTKPMESSLDQQTQPNLLDTWC